MFLENYMSLLTKYYGKQSDNVEKDIFLCICLIFSKLLKYLLRKIESNNFRLSSQRILQLPKTFESTLQLQASDQSNTRRCNYIT